jgi:hypothetical protein
MMPPGWRGSLADGCCVTGDDVCPSRFVPFAAGTAQTFAGKLDAVGVVDEAVANSCPRPLARRGQYHPINVSHGDVIACLEHSGRGRFIVVSPVPFLTEYNSAAKHLGF